MSVGPPTTIALLQLPSLTEVAAVLLLVTIPVGLYLVVTEAWPADDAPLFPNTDLGKLVLGAVFVAVPIALVALLYGNSLFLQVLLLASIPVGLYLLVTESWPRGWPTPRRGEEKLVLAIVLIFAAVTGVLWLQGSLWVVLAAFATPSSIQWLQLGLAALIPVGLYMVVGQTRTVHWTDLLFAIGVFVVPLVVIFHLQGVFAIEVATAIMGFALGHTMEMLDED